MGNKTPKVDKSQYDNEKNRREKEEQEHRHQLDKWKMKENIMKKFKK